MKEERGAPEGRLGRRAEGRPTCYTGLEEKKARGKSPCCPPSRQPGSAAARCAHFNAVSRREALFLFRSEGLRRPRRSGRGERGARPARRGGGAPAASDQPASPCPQGDRFPAHQHVLARPGLARGLPETRGARKVQRPGGARRPSCTSFLRKTFSPPALHGTARPRRAACRARGGLREGFPGTDRSRRGRAARKGGVVRPRLPRAQTSPRDARPPAGSPEGPKQPSSARTGRGTGGEREREPRGLPGTRSRRCGSTGTAARLRQGVGCPPLAAPCSAFARGGTLDRTAAGGGGDEASWKASGPRRPGRRRTDGRARGGRGARGRRRRQEPPWLFLEALRASRIPCPKCHRRLRSPSRSGRSPFAAQFRWGGQNLKSAPGERAEGEREWQNPFQEALAIKRALRPYFARQVAAS